MTLRTTGMEFASEMVVKASLFGMSVCEVPNNSAARRPCREIASAHLA